MNRNDINRELILQWWSGQLGEGDAREVERLLDENPELIQMLPSSESLDAIIARDRTEALERHRSGEFRQWIDSTSRSVPSATTSHSWMRNLLDGAGTLLVSVVAVSITLLVAIVAFDIESSGSDTQSGPDVGITPANSGSEAGSSLSISDSGSSQMSTNDRNQVPRDTETNSGIGNGDGLSATGQNGAGTDSLSGSNVHDGVESANDHWWSDSSHQNGLPDELRGDGIFNQPEQEDLH